MNIVDFLASGAPGKIYEIPGSLFEFHSEVMDTGRSESAGIDYIFELFSSVYYRHTATQDMIIDEDNCRNFPLIYKYNSEKHCHCAASVVLRIKNAVIHNSTIYCQNDDRMFILYESFRFPDRVGDNLHPADMANVEPAEFQNEGANYLYLGSAGSSNFGHWLVDDLPRAKAWIELRRQLGVTCIMLLPSHGAIMDEVRVRSLRVLVDPDIEVQFISPDQPCRIANLHFATPVSFHPRIKNPSAIHFVRTRALQCLDDGGAEPKRRIFVARRPPNSRSIVNFDELWAMLEARGFEMVEPEKFDFAEQVAMFRDAQVVVGQMGAAMTATMFCRPATSLVYLAPVGWAEPFYLDLAAVAGQHYNVLAGPTIGEGPVHLRDFYAPVEPLLHRLKYMGIDCIG